MSASHDTEDSHTQSIDHIVCSNSSLNQCRSSLTSLTSFNIPNIWETKSKSLLLDDKTTFGTQTNRSPAWLLKCFSKQNATVAAIYIGKRWKLIVTNHRSEVYTCEKNLSGTLFYDSLGIRITSQSTLFAFTCAAL